MIPNYVTVPLATLRWLEKEYGELNPTPTQTKETIMYHAGARSVVLRLIEECDPQGHRHIGGVE